jgi:hypothetical protein
VTASCQTVLSWLPCAAVLIIFVPTMLRAIRAFCQYRGLMRSYQGVCGTCGYDLRGNRSGRCPECGTAPRWATDPSNLHG